MTQPVKVGTLPGRFDVTHLAGEPFRMRVAVLQGDGSPVEVADCASARIHVRATIDGEVILARFATDEDPPNLLIEAIDGDPLRARLVAFADSGQTTEWQLTWPGSNGQAVVWWDAEVTDADGEPHQINRPGTITLYHQVTR